MFKKKPEPAPKRTAADFAADLRKLIGEYHGHVHPIAIANAISDAEMAVRKNYAVTAPLR